MRTVLVGDQDASKVKRWVSSHVHHYNNNNDKEKKSSGRDGVAVAENDGCRSRSGSKRIATQTGSRSTAHHASVSTTQFLVAASVVSTASAVAAAVVNYDAQITTRNDDSVIKGPTTTTTTFTDNEVVV